MLLDMEMPEMKSCWRKAKTPSLKKSQPSSARHPNTSTLPSNASKLVPRTISSNPRIPPSFAHESIHRWKKTPSRYGPPAFCAPPRGEGIGRNREGKIRASAPEYPPRVHCKATEKRGANHRQRPQDGYGHVCRYLWIYRNLPQYQPVRPRDVAQRNLRGIRQYCGK